MMRIILFITLLTWAQTQVSAMVGQSDERKRVGRTSLTDSTEDFTHKTKNAMGKLEEAAGEIFNDVKDHAEEVIRSAKKMFDATGKVMDRLTPKMKVFLARIRNPLLRGLPSMDFQRLTENDAVRLLLEITHLPAKLQDKLANWTGTANFTIEELKMIPTDVLQAVTGKSMESLKQLSSDKMEVMCKRLMEPHSHPGNLRKALTGGINCTRLLDIIDRKPTRRARSQSAVMMEHMRKESPPASWSSRKLAEVFRQLGDALSVDDIEEIPTATIRKSLNEISHYDIPMKSARHRLVQKLMGEYSSPAMWPDDYLASMGRLLEDVNVQQLTLLIHRAVITVAPELTEAGIQRETTKIALRRIMARALRAAPTSDTLARILPWMKEDVTFMKDLNLTNLLEALSTVNVTFTAPESNMVAERLEKELMTYTEAESQNKTHYIVDAIARFAEGFDMEYLETLADEVVPKICVKMKNPASRPKSKLILRKLRSNRTLSAAEMGPLFNGMYLEDVEDMPVDELVAALPVLKDQDLPHYIGRKIVDKVVYEVFAQNSSGCHDGFHRLGNLAQYVKPDIIEQLKVIPVALGGEECELNFDEITLTKPQTYALVDNIRDMLQLQSPERLVAVFSSAVMERLGTLVKGLTADDIQALPLDTDLLSVIEVISFYEDELDTSQVEVIADKIRKYFDIENRNVLSDVDEIIVLQIGKFLQYLNSDFELTKFPKELRPAISREIGKSTQLKIPKSKRQALLKFALKNTKVPGKSELQDVTRLPGIDEDVLMDLGNLRCGLTKEHIEKLTKEAVEVHIDELQACPWKEEEAQALSQKALTYNMNLLNFREQMATMGSLLPYLEQGDMDKMRHTELAEIMGYVAKSVDGVELTVKTMESNGFIRERISEEHKNHELKRKRLMKAGFQAMTEVFDTGKCHMVMRLKGKVGDIADLLDMSELQRCLDYIGGEHWEPTTARSLLKKVATLKKWDGLNKQTVGENSEYLLEVLPKLLVGLSAEEMSRLNLSTPDAIASLGEIDGFTEEKLEEGFSTWLSQRTGKHNRSLTGEDMTNLRSFTCGASARYIQENVQADTVRDSLEVLGRSVRKCNRDKLKAYAKKLASSLGNRTESWRLRDIVRMGSLLGGLGEHQLSSLTRWQIKVIEPDVITHMPPEKVREFTADQLGDMTSNQVSAITTMQRSYMNEEQMDALGIMQEVINGGVCVTPVDITVITVALATFRQLLVFLMF